MCLLYFPWPQYNPLWKLPGNISSLLDLCQRASSHQPIPVYVHSNSNANKKLLRDKLQLGQHFFIFLSLFEYHSFTMLCSFLLYRIMNQLYVYLYPPCPTSPSHRSRSSPSRVLCWCFSFPISYFTHGRVFMSMLLSQSGPSSLSSTVFTSQFYVCTSISALQIVN